MARVARNSATYGVATPYGRSHTALDATVEMKLGTSSGDATSANRPVRARHSVDTRTTLARQREGGALRCSIDRYIVLVALYVLPFGGQARIDKYLIGTSKCRVPRDRSMTFRLRHVERHPAYTFLRPER